MLVMLPIRIRVFEYFNLINYYFGGNSALRLRGVHCTVSNVRFSAVRTKLVSVRRALLRGRDDRHEEVPLCRHVSSRHSAGSGVRHRLDDVPERVSFAKRKL